MELIDLSCDRELHLGLSTSVVTGSKSRLLSTSHGIALSISKRVSPLLAGIAEEIALFRGSFRLPDKEFRSAVLHVAMEAGPYLQLFPSRRVGWRMASEDSRKRDGFRWFIVCWIWAIRVIPSRVKCIRHSIMCRIRLNFTNSSCFAVLSGFSSKNGTILSRRSLSRHTL